MKQRSKHQTARGAQLPGAGGSHPLRVGGEIWGIIDRGGENCQASILRVKVLNVLKVLVRYVRQTKAVKPQFWNSLNHINL